MKLYTTKARMIAGGLSFLASAYCVNELAHNRLDANDVFAFTPPVAILGAALYQAHADRGRTLPSRHPEFVRVLNPPRPIELSTNYIGALTMGAVLGVIPGAALKPIIEERVAQRTIEYLLEQDSLAVRSRNQP